MPRRIKAIRGNVVSLNACLSSLESRGLWQRGCQLLGSSTDTVSYNCMASGCEKLGAWREALELLRGQRLSEISYGALVSSCEKAEKWRRALDIFRSGSRHLRLHLHVFNGLTSALGQERRWRDAGSVLEKLAFSFVEVGPAFRSTSHAKEAVLLVYFSTSCTPSIDVQSVCTT